MGKFTPEPPSNFMVKTHGFPVQMFPTNPIHWVNRWKILDQTVAVWKASPRQRYQEGPGVESEQPNGPERAVTERASKLRRIAIGPYTHINNRFIYIYIHIYIIIYIYIHIQCISILSIYPSIHLSIYPSIHLSIYLSIHHGHGFGSPRFRLRKHASREGFNLAGCGASGALEIGSYHT